jgi:tetratricopeptide (TPR) repeat protein
MNNWLIHYKNAMRFVKKHQLEKAVSSFEKALKSVPADRKSEEAEMLFYLAAVLRRLNFTEVSRKILIKAVRKNKRGYACRFLFNVSNCYGMNRNQENGLDDWHAFYSVQLQKYFEQRKIVRISSAAERDALGCIILDEWKTILRSVCLNGMNTDEKLAYYRKREIVFPFLFVPVSEVQRPLFVDFRTGMRLHSGKCCSCGSRLPFVLCCGNTPSGSELANGLF